MKIHNIVSLIVLCGALLGLAFFHRGPDLSTSKAVYQLSAEDTRGMEPLNGSELDPSDWTKRTVALLETHAPDGFGDAVIGDTLTINGKPYSLAQLGSVDTQSLEVYGYATNLTNSAQLLIYGSYNNWPPSIYLGQIR